jgi:hypothetical protein
MPRSRDAIRIDAFDLLCDVMRDLHEETHPLTPFEEERMTQAVHELIFEGSPAEIRKAIATLKQLAAR